MDALLEAGQAMLSEHFSGGAGLLVVTFLVALLYIFLEEFKKAVSDRVTEWLKSAHNLLVILVSIAVGLLLWDKHLLWGLGVFAAAVAVYFFLRWRYPALLSRKSFVAGVTVGAIFVFAIANSVDVYLEKRRSESFDVVFLLPPDGVPKEPDKFFAGLKKALSVSFNGVDHVRIVPTKLTPEDVAKYTIDSNDLLAYRTSEGYPKVFIRNQYNPVSGQTPNESRLKMLLTPYQRRPAGNGIEPVQDWRLRALEGGQEKMHRVELLSSFDLIAFLASKRLFNLSPEAQQTIWRNILAEYAQFLALNAPVCGAREQLDKLGASAGALTEPQVREVLNVPCVELHEDAKAETEASDRDYNTFALRFAPNSSE